MYNNDEARHFGNMPIASLHGAKGEAHIISNRPRSGNVNNAPIPRPPDGAKLAQGDIDLSRCQKGETKCITELRMTDIKQHAVRPLRSSHHGIPPDSSIESPAQTTEASPLSSPRFLHRAKARLSWFNSKPSGQFRVLNRRSWQGDGSEPVRIISEPQPNITPLPRNFPEAPRGDPQSLTSRALSLSTTVGERLHKMKRWLSHHWTGPSTSSQMNHDKERELDELTFSNTVLNGRTTAMVGSPPGTHDGLSLTEQPIPWELPGDIFKSPILLPDTIGDETPVGELESESVCLASRDELVKEDSGIDSSHSVNSWSDGGLVANKATQTTPSRGNSRAPGDVAQPQLRPEKPSGISPRESFQRWLIPSIERIYSANGWDSPPQSSKRPLSRAPSNRFAPSEPSASKHRVALGHHTSRTACRLQVQFADNKPQLVRPPSSVGVDQTPTDSVESFLTRPTKVLSTTRFRVRQGVTKDTHSSRKNTNGPSAKPRLRLPGRSYSLRSPFTSIKISSGRVSRRIRQRARAHRSYLSFGAVGSAIWRRRPSYTRKRNAPSSQSYDQLLGFLDARDKQSSDPACRGSTKCGDSTSGPESYASGESTFLPRLPRLRFTPTFSGRTKMWGIDILKSSHSNRFSSEVRSASRRESSIDVLEQPLGGKEYTPAKADSSHEFNLANLSPGVFSSSCMAHASSSNCGSFSPTHCGSVVEDNKPKSSFTSRIQYKLRYPTGPPDATPKTTAHSYHRVVSTSSTADSSVTPVAASPRSTALSDKDRLDSSPGTPLCPLTVAKDGKEHCVKGSGELAIWESEIPTLTVRSPQVKKRAGWLAQRSQPKHRSRHSQVQSTESIATDHSLEGENTPMLPSSYDGGQDIRGYPVISPTAIDMTYTAHEPTQHFTSPTPVCMYKDEHDFVCVQPGPQPSKRRFNRPRRPSMTSLLSQRTADTAEAPAHRRTAKFLRLVSQWTQLASPRTRSRSTSAKASPAVSSASDRFTYRKKRPVSVATSQGIPKSAAYGPNPERTSFAAKRSSYPYFHLVGFPPCFMAVLPKTPLTQHNSRMSCSY
ncbi:hypothetical protein IWQ62_002767 [Dispira parvispora]|uniref:Uncharacterized protein n=1 Tax=Dispira parvispora TaxID=1520584 RepID=A0A9W8APT7_9FUNG|nr:hypothetical protein IWQ62_002767 [Dispira parvispora]